MRRCSLAILGVLVGSLVIASGSIAAAQQGLSEVRGRVVDAQNAILARRHRARHQSGHRHLSRSDQQRRRHVLRDRHRPRHLRGGGATVRLQEIGPPRHRPVDRADDHRRHAARSWRPRRDGHRDHPGAARRRHLVRDRRQRHARRHHRDAVGQSQLHRVPRPAPGRRAQQLDDLVWRRHGQRQRPELGVEQLHGRWRQQQRRLPRPGIRVAGAHRARVDSGIPGAHQSVRRRVRPHHRRRRQRDHQAGLEPVSRQRLQLLDRFVGHGEGLLRPDAEPAQAADHQEAMGRHAGRPDRPRPRALTSSASSASSSTKGDRRSSRTRPDKNFAISQDTDVWNVLGRVDHQLSSPRRPIRCAGCSRARRRTRSSIRATRIDSLREETDIDQTVVGQLNSVFGNTKFNTLRVSWTMEDINRSNPQYFANGQKQWELPATQSYLRTSSTCRIPPASAASTTPGTWKTRSPGSCPASAAITTSSSARSSRSINHRFDDQTNMNGTFTFRSDAAFNANDFSTYPERLSIRVPVTRRQLHAVEGDRRLRAGQVARQSAADAEPRRALRPRDHPDPRAGGGAADARQRRLSGRQEQRRAAAGRRLRRQRQRVGGVPRRLRHVLRPHEPHRARRDQSPGRLLVVIYGAVPGRAAGSRSVAGPPADRSDARQRPGRQSGAAQSTGSGRHAQSQHRHRVPRFPGPQDSLQPQHHVRLRAADRAGRCR